MRQGLFEPLLGPKQQKNDSSMISTSRMGFHESSKMQKSASLLKDHIYGYRFRNRAVVGSVKLSCMQKSPRAPEDEKATI